MLRHVQKSSLFPARINVAFPPPSPGTGDVVPQLQHQQKLLGKGGLLLTPCLDVSSSPVYSRGTSREGTNPTSSGSIFPSPPGSGPGSPHPGKKGLAAAGDEAPRASSFQPLSLPSKARPGKVGKTFKAGFRAQFEPPGLPWGGGEADRAVSPSGGC